MSSGKPLLIAILLLGAILVVQVPDAVDTAQAANTAPWSGVWSREVINTGTTAPNYILMANNGRTEGIAWHTTSGSILGFATRDATTNAWTTRSTAIDGATLTVPCLVDLVGFGVGKWAMLAGETCSTTAARLFVTTDNGTTWALAGVNSFTVTSTALRDNIRIASASDGNLQLAYRSSSTNEVAFRQSSDGGATFSAVVKVSNNDGSPTDSGATQPWTPNIVSITAKAGLTQITWRGQTAQSSPFSSYVFRVESTDGGNYWTTPYTTHLGSTFRPLWHAGGSGTGATGASPANSDNNVHAADGGGATTYVQSSTSIRWGTRFDNGAFIEQTCDNGLQPLLPDNTPRGYAVRDPDADDSIWFSALRCSSQSNTTLQYSNGGAWVPSIVVGADTATNAYAIDMSTDRSFFAFQNVAFGGRLEVYTQQTPDKLPSIPAIVLDVSGGLVGFKVDGVGQNAIARFEDGTVRSYAAYNLIETGSASTPNCERADGVDALYTVAASYLVYIDCDSGGGANAIRIRAGNLGLPTFPAGCGSECQDPVNQNDWLRDIDVPSQMLDLGSVSARPYYYARNTLPGWTLTDNACAAFAFSSFNGKVGVFEPCYINNGYDRSRIVERNLNDGGAPISDFCVWKNENRDYLAGVTPSGSTGAFEVTFKNSDGGDNYYQTPLLSPAFVNGNAYGGAKVLACAGDTIWLGKDPYLYRMRVIGSIVELAAKNVGGAIDYHGLAVSGDAKWLAYARSGHVYILNAETLAQVKDIEKPSGPLERVELDQQGQVVWIATYTKIARQEIWPETTGVPKSPVVDDWGNPLPGGGNQTVPPDGNGNCPAGYVKIRINGAWVCQLDPSGGIDPPTGEGPDLIEPIMDGLTKLFGEWGPWILAILLIFGLAGTGFYLWGKGMAVLLGLIGYSMSIVIGIIPIWNLAVFVLLCATAIVLKQRIWE